MKRVAGLILMQLALILLWAAYHEHVRASASTFRIPLRPVDPYDVLRGRYFQLNPLDASVNTGEAGTLLAPAAAQRLVGTDSSYAGPVLVGFCPVEGVRRVCDVRRADEPHGAEHGRVWARARATISHQQWSPPVAPGTAMPPGWMVTLDLGLDRFYLPDRLLLPGGETDSGWELEVSYRDGQPLLPRRLWFRGQPVVTGR